MIDTFEEAAGAVRRLSGAQSLAEASAGLPQGAYSTLRTYDGSKIVRLAQHARRLEDSAGGGAALPEDRLRGAIAGALRATSHAESRLRVTFAPPRLFVSVEPFVPLPEALYRDGVSCATLPLRRERPQAKDTRFISQAGQAYSALTPGVHEGLMVADDGAILEGLF